MATKSTTDKAKSKVKPTAQPAQPTGETAPNTPPPIIDTLTPDEQKFIGIWRKGGEVLAERDAKRAALIAEKCEALKSLEDEDFDKALDFIDRITGKGGHFLSPRKDSDYQHMFWQLSLHLACNFLQSWIGVETIFENPELSGDDAEIFNLPELVRWINTEIWNGVNSGLLDEHAALNWINTPRNGWKSPYHAEWVDEHGVQLWLGRDSLKKRQEADESDESTRVDSEGGDDE